jgi:hypothetical protein
MTDSTDPTEDPKFTDYHLSDLGADARRVLDSPAFQEAIRRMRSSAYDEFKQVPIRDTEGLRLLAQAARLTDKVVTTLHEILNQGKLARATIDIDAERAQSQNEPARGVYRMKR